MCVCVCVHVCVCMCVCVHINAWIYTDSYQFVFLLEVIFSQASLKTLSFDQHLMYEEQVNDHTSCNGSTVVLR